MNLLCRHPSLPHLSLPCAQAFWVLAHHMHMCLFGCHRSNIGRGDSNGYSSFPPSKKKKRKKRKRDSDTESSEWGIKIYLQVTMAAMIAARNFLLKMNVTCPPSHPLPPRNQGKRSLSSSILHCHSAIYFIHSHNCSPCLMFRLGLSAAFPFPEL